jgi:hypothetical protein
MLQALYLANHPQLRQKVAHPQGRVASIVQQLSGDADRIAEVFLATVSRPPTEKEATLALEYVKKASSPQKGLEGLMWGLLNSNEFLFNQ